MLVLVGKSGSGKTTIEEELIQKHGFKRAISHTTRPKREKDIDGYNYFFVTKEEMEKLRQENKLAERIEYLGEVYALTKEQCKDDRVVVVAPDGLMQLKEKNDLDIFSIYIDVSEDVRYKRMINRGDSIENVEKRIKNDDSIFDGIAEKEVDIKLCNDSNDVNAIVKIVLEKYEEYKRERG